MHFSGLLGLQPSMPRVQGLGGCTFVHLFEILYSHLSLAFVLMSVIYITINIGPYIMCSFSKSLEFQIVYLELRIFHTFFCSFLFIWISLKNSRLQWQKAMNYLQPSGKKWKRYLHIFGRILFKRDFM